MNEDPEEGDGMWDGLKLIGIAVGGGGLLYYLVLEPLARWLY